MILDNDILEGGDDIRTGQYAVVVRESKILDNGALHLDTEIFLDPKVGPDAPEGYVSQEGEHISAFIDVDFSPNGPVVTRFKNADTYSRMEKTLKAKTRQVFNAFGVSGNFEPDDFIGCKAWIKLGKRKGKGENEGFDTEEIKAFRPYEEIEEDE